MPFCLNLNTNYYPRCLTTSITRKTTKPALSPITRSHVRSLQLTVKSRAAISADSSSAMAASNSVRVAAAQMTSINDLAANFATCSRLVKEAASAGAKLLCMPESFSFIGARDGDSVKIAEPLDGPIMKQYCSLAREFGIWLSLGGFQERGSDDEHLCNTHVIVDDTGKIRSSYRKIHLFDVDVPGGRVYKESSFTEAGKVFTCRLAGK